MESTSNFELVGGVTRVVLYPAKTPLPDDAEGGYVVDLSAGGASYTESRLYSAGQYTVRHTLKFSCEHADSPFTAKELAAVARCGVVADITLSTGASLRVGWSERWGVEFALRLISAEFASGEEATDYPLRTWVWESTDLTDNLLG
ncbi:MAG: hypothetical protein R3Y16_06115 [Rikenellaceae bacterium]